MKTLHRNQLHLVNHMDEMDDNVKDDIADRHVQINEEDVDTRNG